MWTLDIRASRLARSVASDARLLPADTEKCPAGPSIASSKKAVRTATHWPAIRSQSVGFSPIDRVRKMELRQLRYFVAVAEELHFGRAAARLYVSQPAVSEQIRKLEAELGVRLLNRCRATASLSEAGAALLVEARRVLQQVEAARLALQEVRDGTA